jgi:tetratricopeptide (TPR) repeat protein
VTRFVRDRAAAALLAGALAALGSAQEHPPHPVPSVPEALLQRPIALRDGIGAAHDRVSTGSKQAQAYYDQGLACLHAYAWIDAARSFTEALRQDPSLAVAHVGLGYAYEELNKPTAAATSLERARALLPGLSLHDRRHVEIRILQAAAERAPRDATKAAAYRKALDDALEAFPSDTELWLQRGVAESPDPADRGQGSTEASVRFYERALQLRPDHFAAHHYLTHASENAGRLDAALGHADAFARLAPAVPHAHHMRGHNLRRAGRVDDAIASFRAALDLETARSRAEDIPAEHDWHHAHNLDLLASSHEYLGQVKTAEALLRRSFQIPSPLVLQEFNKHEWPAFLLARKRPEEAQAASSALTASPSALVRGIGHVMTARALLALGRHSAAVDAGNLALNALRLAGDEARLAAPHVKALQAEMFLRSGQRGQSRPVFDEALRMLRALPGPDGWSQALFRLEALARVGVEAGDWELVERAALALKDHDDTYAGTHRLLALVAAQKGDRATAVRELTIAERAWSRADPDFPELMEIRARLAELQAERQDVWPAAARRRATTSAGTAIPRIRPFDRLAHATVSVPAPMAVAPRANVNPYSSVFFVAALTRTTISNWSSKRSGL